MARMQLLLLLIFFSFIVCEHVNLIWRTAQRTTFPMYTSGQTEELLVMESETPIEIQWGVALFVHSSSHLDLSVVVRPEDKYTVTGIETYFLQRWTTSYTDLAFKVRPTESSTDCSKHAVVLKRYIKDAWNGKETTTVVSREFDDSNSLRYTEQLDQYSMSPNLYYLYLEGPEGDECTFELIQAGKRYHKYIQHTRNAPPKESRVPIDEAPKQESVEPAMDPKKIYWRVDGPTRLVLRNEKFVLPLGSPARVHFSDDLRENIIHELAFDAGSWTSALVTMKFSFKVVDDRADCSKGGVLLRRLELNIIGQVSRIVRVAVARPSESFLLEYSEKRMPCASNCIYEMHQVEFEDEEGAEFSDDSSYESPDAIPCRFQIESASKEYRRTTRNFYSHS